jgi:hypothetical protein
MGDGRWAMGDGRWAMGDGRPSSADSGHGFVIILFIDKNPPDTRHEHGGRVGEALGGAGVLEVPAAGTEVAEDGEELTAFEQELVVEAGDLGAPPLVVEAPAVLDGGDGAAPAAPDDRGRTAPALGDLDFEGLGAV